MTSNTSSFISETLRQLDELNAETYLSAADQRYNQAERLEMMADAATNQADKAALLAAARGLYGKMDKLQARADTKDHQWRDPAPSQLDELSPETYWSAADKRRQQAVGLWQLDKDMGNRLPDKDKINAAEVIAAKKSNKLAAKGNDTGRARRAQDEQNRLPTGRLSPATLAAMRVDTDRASKARKVDQARAMGAYDEQNRLNKAGLNPAWRAATDAEARARRDQDVQNATLQKLGLDHKHSALLRKAGLSSAQPPAGRPPVPPPPAGRPSLPPVPPSQLDELSPETYKSAADKREKQAIALDHMATSKHPSTIDDDRAALSNAADAAYNKRNDLRRGQGQAEYRVKTQKDKERQTDQLLGAGINPSGSLLRKAGLSSAQPPAGRPPVPPPPAGRPPVPPPPAGRPPVPPPPAGRPPVPWSSPATLRRLPAPVHPPVPPRRQDESKVFRIYRNSDQSATVVMESGVAVWLAPKSVNKVLSESGNINRTKLHRLLESRIWK